MAGLTDISLGNFTDIIYAPADTVAPVGGDFSSSSFLLVGDVQTVGDISDEATIVDVQAYGQKYLKKLVGSANASAIEVVCNYDPTDAGQIDLLSAYDTTTQRAIGVVMKENDGDFDADTTNGTFNVFNALIASASVANSFDETRTITFSIVPANGIGDYTALGNT